ncbi:MAG: bifunctional 4-hydroxy-2-oxoglutarate aldolase/2-dehydro-3-deoxy-phosphogluconate aldolase [Synechococcaceae cyanobacterium]|nr:bifunctional 4-hydroxy-2-oxoglutarate aldolase/2-dehydro-3-deoxy-phosphogluconate aldolase [Synechococcaceae cyanobacterium]
MRRQPLLVVLRPGRPLDAAPLLARFEELGLLHVEIAWQPGPGWIEGCRELVRAHPRLRLGAASVCRPEGLAAAREAGLGYAVSPVLEAGLVRAAAAAGITLVPGVLTPSEVHRARRWGCPIVKLFPAGPLGSGYWRGLRDPLGEPLPFCIAAGGLAPPDVLPWLEAGVDAVALGSGLATGAQDPVDSLTPLLGLLTRSR